MNKTALNNYINRGNKYITTEDYKDLKRELTKNIFQHDDGFIVDYYFKEYDIFTNYINRLNNTKLSDLKIEQIKILNYINKIKEIDLKYILIEL